MRRSLFSVAALTILFAVILGGARIIGEVQTIHHEVQSRLRAVDQIAEHSSAVLKVLSSEPELMAYVRALQNGGKDPEGKGFLGQHLEQFETLIRSFMIPQPDGTRLEIVNVGGSLLGQVFSHGGRVQTASLESLAARTKRRLHNEAFQQALFSSQKEVYFGLAHTQSTLWLQVARTFQEGQFGLVFSIPLSVIQDVQRVVFDDLQLDQYVSATDMDSVLHRVGMDTFWDAIPTGDLPEALNLPGAHTLQALFRNMPMLEIHHTSEKAGIQWSFRVALSALVMRWFRVEGAALLVVFVLLVMAVLLRETTLSESAQEGRAQEVVSLKQAIQGLDAEVASRRLLKADMDQQLKRLRQMKADHLALQVELSTLRHSVDTSTQTRLTALLGRAETLHQSHRESQDWLKAHQVRILHWADGVSKRSALVERLLGRVSANREPLNQVQPRR